jgi:hypothetical protein
MAFKSNPLCRLQCLPKPLRLFIAALLIGFGFFLWITPFPGGIILISIGLVLSYCASERLRPAINRRLLAHPRVGQILKPYLAACDNCSQKDLANSGKPSKGLALKKISEP